MQIDSSLNLNLSIQAIFTQTSSGSTPSVSKNGAPSRGDSATFSQEAMQSLAQMLQGAATQLNDLSSGTPATVSSGSSSIVNTVMSTISAFMSMEQGQSSGATQAGSANDPTSAIVHALRLVAKADGPGSNGAQGVSQKQLTALSNQLQKSDPSLFSQLDTDGSQTLTLADLQNGRSTLSQALQQANPQVYAQFDADGQGSLSDSDISQGVAQLKANQASNSSTADQSGQAGQEQELEQAFAQMLTSMATQMNQMAAASATNASNSAGSTTSTLSTNPAIPPSASAIPQQPATRAILHALALLAQSTSTGAQTPSSSGISQRQLQQVSNQLQKSDPALFAQLDTDGGSTLSLSDLQNGRSALSSALQHSNPQVFATFDGDGQSQLSNSDIKNGFSQLFQQAASNNPPAPPAQGGPAGGPPPAKTGGGGGGGSNSSSSSTTQLSDQVLALFREGFTASQISQQLSQSQTEVQQIIATI